MKKKWNFPTLVTKVVGLHQDIEVHNILVAGKVACSLGRFVRC